MILLTSPSLPPALHQMQESARGRLCCHFAASLDIFSLLGTTTGFCLSLLRRHNNIVSTRLIFKVRPYLWHKHKSAPILKNPCIFSPAQSATKSQLHQLCVKTKTQMYSWPLWYRSSARNLSWACQPGRTMPSASFKCDKGPGHPEVPLLFLALLFVLEKPAWSFAVLQSTGSWALSVALHLSEVKAAIKLLCLTSKPN